LKFKLNCFSFLAIEPDGYKSDLYENLKKRVETNLAPEPMQVEPSEPI
jgi:hypothetical protein